MFELSLFLRDRLIGRSSFSIDEVRIGRSADNEVQIDNLALSRYHASIEHIDGVHILKDFGSQNGTFVNGERVVGRRGLDDGDRIGFGKFTVIFHAEKAAVASAEVRDQASFALAGETIVHNVPRDVHERACPFVGFLESIPNGVEEPRVFPLARDVFVVGAIKDADLAVEGAGDRVAAIVRGWRGFSVLALASAVARNGKPIEGAVELVSRDELTFGKARYRFLVGRPDGGP